MAGLWQTILRALKFDAYFVPLRRTVALLTTGRPVTPPAKRLSNPFPQHHHDCNHSGSRRGGGGHVWEGQCS
jgi:hypothetical protein